MNQFKESNDIINDTQALRERLDNEGYLFFRNAVPQEVLLNVRKDFINILQEEQWIKEADEYGASPYRVPLLEGEEENGFFDVYDKVMKLESFYSLPHHESIMSIMRKVLGETAFPHPLSVARIIFPKNEEATTPPHQDYPNNQGTQNLLACWMPLSDCPKEMGSLSVLEGSNQFQEILPLAYHIGAGSRQAVLPEKYQKLRWLEADFNLGDILLFPSLTVHKALNNLSGDKMRISVDFRFQLEGESLTENSLKPHFQRFSWEDVYQNWTDKTHQYYWKNKDYRIDEWNDKLHKIDMSHEELKEVLRQNASYKKERVNRTKSWRDE